MSDQTTPGPAEMRLRLEQQIKRARDATRSTPASFPGAAAPWTPAPRAAGPRVGSMIERMGASLVSVWRRPRVRLALIGIVLVALGALKVISSTWAVPVIVIGVVMIVIAWVGSRLEGRFAIEWGEEGTQFEMRAQLKPYARQTPPPALQPLDTGDMRGQLDAIEGEAHTVELRVAELKELIDAAQTTDTVAGSSAAPAAVSPRQDDASAA